MVKKLIPILFGVVLGVAGCSRQDQPAIPAITLVNRAGFDAVEVVVAPAGTGQWGTNILPDDTLAMGQAVTCPLPEKPAVTAWDVKTVDADGRETVWTGVRLRANARVTLNMDNQTPVVTLE